ncbi:MAG: heme biosynthesis HemY N-terminal domain-containing protein [Alcanivoracaceae bacterium]|nr:heme biosynthesis HemY N-terminal domain-containing protein [Alcanivoracaceae bacterium]
MKRLLLLLVLLAIAAAVTGHMLISDRGYVLMQHGDVHVEMTLVFFLLVTVTAAVSLVLLTLLLAIFWDMVSPFQVRGRWGRYLARRRLLAGFHALVAGKWKQAERMLNAAAADPDWTVPAQLGAAWAAEQQFDETALEEHLRVAGEQRRGALPAGLQRAWYTLRMGAPEQALEQLQLLRTSHGDNPLLLVLTARTCDRLGDWETLTGLLPRTKAFLPASDYAALERRAWHGRMKALAETTDPAAERLAAVRQHWRAMPGHLQHDPALAAQYAGYLAQLGDGEGALKQVRKTMEHGWDDRLPAVLESINNVAPERLLAQLEQWLGVRPGNASLLLTAGRVALRAQLWGKARSFFNEASNAGSLVALEEYLRLSIAMGDESGAEGLQQRRLSLLSQSLPDLPLPQKRRQKDPR